MLAMFLLIFLVVLCAASAFFVAACLLLIWLMGFSFTCLLPPESDARTHAESVLVCSLPFLPVVAIVLGLCGTTGVAMRWISF